MEELPIVESPYDNLVRARLTPTTRMTKEKLDELFVSGTPIDVAGQVP